MIISLNSVLSSSGCQSAFAGMLIFYRCFTVSCLFPQPPFYLKEHFRFLHDTHSRHLRSSENLTLLMPSHSTKFCDKSFAVQAVRLWNALPLAIRQAQSLNSFKNLVRDHYLSF
ncbi:hypothetical protein PYW08_016439 [Mythimna loreyi]|uniref:Uncharacterized protein n=1 Tax=Mythimna loreyi TaxID=667449 RepID=A0ACC2QWZ2_9NEOP|nr:hypothetical protein PYW08_016439 [Mythimna loreyi]